MTLKIVPTAPARPRIAAIVAWRPFCCGPMIFGLNRHEASLKPDASILSFEKEIALGPRCWFVSVVQPEVAESCVRSRDCYRISTFLKGLVSPIAPNCREHDLPIIHQLRFMPIINGVSCDERSSLAAGRWLSQNPFSEAPNSKVPVGF